MTLCDGKTRFVAETAQFAVTVPVTWNVLTVIFFVRDEQVGVVPEKLFQKTFGVIVSR